MSETPEGKGDRPHPNEELLYTAGTYTFVLGLGLLIASVVVASIAAAFGYNWTIWLVAIGLSFLVILSGAAVSFHFGRIVRPGPVKIRRAIPSAPSGTWTAPGPGVAGPEAARKSCVACGRLIPLGAAFCPYCRHRYAAP